MAISRIRTCQRCKVLLPHFQLDRTAKDLKFCSRTSIWPDYQWCDMKSIPHFCSANSLLDVKFRFRTSVLPWLPTIWSSASAHQLCSARIFKGLKLCFRNSALSLRPKIRSSAFRTFARPGLRKIPFFFRICCTRTSKYGYVHFRISSLPGLTKMWSSASALLLCLDFQRSEVPLSVLPLGHDFERSRPSSTLVLPGLPSMGKSTSAFHLCRNFQRCEVSLSVLPLSQDSKDLVHLPHLFCQDFQIWISPLPHFIFARTSKDLKFRFHTSALPWLPKMWSSASSVPLCVLVTHSHTNLYVFRETSQLKIETT